MNILYKAWINETGEKAPATVSIEPTIRCNMHCPMCDRTHKEDFHKHLENEMPTDMIIDNIKILGETRVKQVLVIGGGEPLFRRETLVNDILRKNGVSKKLSDNICKRVSENIRCLQS